MKTLSSGEHVVEPVVTRLHALLHAGLDDRVARGARFVARRLRESGPSFLLNADEGVDGLAGVPGLVEPLGGHEPRSRHDFAVHPAHPRVSAVAVFAPHPALLAAHTPVLL